MAMSLVRRHPSDTSNGPQLRASDSVVKLKAQLDVVPTFQRVLSSVFAAPEGKFTQHSRAVKSGI